jgi:hypothetical protein
MPTNIRMFFWLSVAVVAIWIIRIALFWIPVAHYLSGLSGNYIHTALVGTALGAVPLIIATLLLDWLVAYRHHNWARWAFVGLFLLRESVLFANAKRHALMGFNEYLRLHLTTLHQLVVTLPLLAASILVFAGNSRGWFKASAQP